MAHARVEVIQADPPPRKVILELTEDEAAMVYILAGAVEGSGHHSVVALEIYKALRPCFPNIKCGDFLGTYPRLQKPTPQLPRVEA